MADYKTPGVYVEEITTLPPSVGQVPTAVPAFIGHTMKAERAGKSLLNSPRHITSLLEYHEMFGKAPDYGEIKVTYDGKNVAGVEFQHMYYIYDTVRMYFANGGGECYIVSVGSYSDEVTMDRLQEGINACAKEDHPTMLICPDAMLLKKKEQAYSLQQSMLKQCNELQDRVAILDVFGGYKSRADEDIILDFRNGVGVNFLKYGTSYYPWIQTTLTNDFGFENIKLVDKDGGDLNFEDLITDPTAVKNLKQALADQKIVNAFVSAPLGEGSLNDKFFRIAEGTAPKDEMKHYATVLKELIDKIIALRTTGITNTQVDNELRLKTNSTSALATVVRGLSSIDKGATIGVINDADYADFELDSVPASKIFEGLDDEAMLKKAKGPLKSVFESVIDILLAIKADTKTIADNLDKVVYDTNILYQSIVNEVKKKANLLPPSGAIAGVYAQTDTNRGVWKAPANVSLASVVGPWVKIDNRQQEDLNVDVNSGKSVNAIRAFTGKGTLVWGARTLAGNDNEWRYISVRRFFNMVEKSVKLSTNWAVFEPNDTTTWIRVKAMIENFLTNLWKAGALAGSTPTAAFFVNIGLGTTMSQVDILEGRMNVEIGMAVVRPAEFIILKFSHKLQEA